MARELYLNTHQLPLVDNTAFLRAPRPFIHGDRVMEVHDMIYLAGGSMQVIEEGIEYRLLPGNLLFLQAGCHHWGTEQCTPDTAWYYVHFLLPENRGTPKEQLLVLPKFLNEPRNIQLEEQLQEISGLFSSDSPLQKALCNVKFYEFLLTCCQQDLNAQPVSSAEKRISQVIDYLETHQQGSLDTADLAARMQLSYKHLGTVFKEQTGHSIVDYHTRLRMQTAAKLLRETDLSITQISEKLGFGDAFYFSNVFKKIHHESPRSYRQSLCT